MSKTTEWFLELQDSGLVTIYQSVVEDIDYEELETVLTPNLIENDN